MRVGDVFACARAQDPQKQSVDEIGWIPLITAFCVGWVSCAIRKIISSLSTVWHPRRPLCRGVSVGKSTPIGVTVGSVSTH